MTGTTCHSFRVYFLYQLPQWTYFLLQKRLQVRDVMGGIMISFEDRDMPLATKKNAP